MQRVSVVGNAGSGKSYLAQRLAAILGLPYVELDAIHHLPNWEPIDPDAFVTRVRVVTDGDGWVIDGNYRAVAMDGPVWQRADTVVWLDPPRGTVMRRITTRTIRRCVRREKLWNGNRERLRDVISWDPHRSIIRWAWTQHAEYRQRYAAAMTAPEHAHLDFVRLASHDEAERWLHDLRAG